MALWVHKHTPQSLDTLSCHPRITDQLRQIAQNGNVPNLIFYGQPGAGRKTRALAFLHALYGDGVHQLKSTAIEIEGASSTAQSIFQISSNHHVEVSADEMGRKDKDVIGSLVKKSVGQTSNILTARACQFRIVIIKDADHLSWDAQAALRRTMETYHRNCRIILICESLSKLMKPLRSRCLCIRVPLPSIPEIVGVLKTVVVKEALTPKPEYLNAIAELSRRNLERALLLLEMATIQGYPQPNNLAYLPWELSVLEMVKVLITSPSPHSLIEIRNIAYELFASNLSMHKVLELVHRLLMTHLNDGAEMDELRLTLSRLATVYGAAMGQCQNQVCQLEAFFASAAVAIRQKQIESGRA